MSSRRPSASPTSSPGCSPIGTTTSSPTFALAFAVLVVAHGNSLRALLKHLEGVSDADIAEVNLPTGIPRLYELGDDLQVQSVRYLGDASAVEAAAEAVRRQAG